MAAGERRRRADSGMVALLQALSETKEDEEGARLLGLSRVAEGTLFAATWPTALDKVRSLTNSDGEQAMPLFSGLDNLEAAARRFGWLNPDGSLSFREMPARDALQSAITQSAHFVVLDIHAEYSTEFTRDEVARVLARPARAASPRAAERPKTLRDRPLTADVIDPPTKDSIKPSRLSGRPRSPSGRLAAAAIKKAQGGIAEIDLPFSERGTGPIVAPPPRGGVSIEETRRPGTGKRDPRVDPQPTDSQGGAGAPARKETKKAMPVAHPSRTAPLQPRPAPQPEAKVRVGEAGRGRKGTQPAFRMPPVDPPTEPLNFFVPIVEQPPPVPAAAMPAEQPKAKVIDKVPVLEELPALDQMAVPSAATPPTAGFAAGPPTLPSLDDLAALNSLPPLLADGASAAPAPPEPAAHKPAAKAAAPAPKPAAAAEPARDKRGARAAVPEAQPEAEAEPEAAEAAESPQELRPPVTPLENAVLDAIAQALRSFPEVEWASELADENDAPLIAVRVEPSFQTRIGDIEAAVLAAGERTGVSFSVLMLRDLEQMKEARAQGGTFFPWRKRSVPKR